MVRYFTRVALNAIASFLLLDRKVALYALYALLCMRSLTIGSIIWVLWLSDLKFAEFDEILEKHEAIAEFTVKLQSDAKPVRLVRFMSRSIEQFLQDKIAASPQQRIPFSEYMSAALYHPHWGYYSCGKGLGADFTTSAHLCADFGEMLAEQFVELWQILGCPHPFTIAEMGAGQGIIAGDILHYCQRKYPNCFEAIDYRILEKSTVLKRQQQHRLAALPIQWCEWGEIAENSLIGCCFSNELVDAFPVHQIAIESGRLQEVYVTATTEGFAEVLGELSIPQLAEYFEWVGIDVTQYADGYRSEVNLAALDWMATVASRLQRGYVLTIDYGYTAERYYSPGRSQGTLQCYHQHQHHNNPYLHVGCQDLTAHVDFTALQYQGDRCGLATIGFTQQALFLMALGLGDRISTLGGGTNGTQTATVRDIATIMQRRQVLQGLIDPMGVGRFGVLVQGKGLSEEERGRSIQGLKVPAW
jgi:SAM-dependent MidA family methyltransferase